MANTFPASDFYVTCATVIPVLFLAVAVQGRAYERVLRTANSASAYFVRSMISLVWPLFARVLGVSRPPERHRSPWHGPRMILAGITFTLLQGAAMIILLAGGIGEGTAIYVLYRGSERMGDRYLVLLATLALAAAVFAGPLLAFLWSYIRGPLFGTLDQMMQLADEAETAEDQSTASPKAAKGAERDLAAEDNDP